MKRTMVLVGKRKMVVMVASSSLAELSKPPVKVAIGIVEGLLPDSFLDKKLLAK